MAKAKTTPATKNASAVDDGTITREKAKAPKVASTPKASTVEKTESFTAAFKTDAHTAADHFLGAREEISREESDAGNEGIRVTVIYK